MRLTGTHWEDEGHTGQMGDTLGRWWTHWADGDTLGRRDTIRKWGTHWADGKLTGQMEAHLVKAAN